MDPQAAEWGVGPIETGWGEEVGLDEEGRLPEDPKLLRGALPNGLRYSILKNEVPRGRLFVNLEVHAGSVDETEDQQGLAHFLEHMVFMGTDKYPQPDDLRKVLGRLGMSQLADANAYTDFRSTVYTLSAPVRGEAQRRFKEGENVQAAGRDTLFRAGLVEAPTTIMTPPHERTETSEEEEEEEEEAEEAESVSSSAAAAGAEKTEEGKEEGDNVGLVLELLEEMCLKARLRQDHADSERQVVLNEMRDAKDVSDRIATSYYEQLFAETLLPKRFPIGKEEQVKAFSTDDLRAFYEEHYHPSNMHLFVVGDIDPSAVLDDLRRVFAPYPAPPIPEGQAPPFGWATPADAEQSEWEVRGQALTHEFGAPFAQAYHQVLHPQIPTFSLTITTKEGLEANTLNRHLMEELLDSLVGMALDSRCELRRLREGDPGFSSVDWMYLNSAREGCVLNSLSVSGEAKSWERAVIALAEEVGGLVRYGLAERELQRLLKTLLMQYRQDADREETTNSEDKLSHLVECAETGDAYMSAKQRYALLEALAPAVSLEAVNRRAQQLYAFAGLHAPDASPHPSTAIFVCGPTGEEMAGVSDARIRELLQQGAQLAQPFKDEVEVPEFLCDPDEMDALQAELKPTLERVPADPAVPGLAEELGVELGVLSNGVRLAYKQTDFEKNEIAIQVHVLGGRATETALGGDKKGAMMLGVPARLESGLGKHSAEAIQKFCSLYELDLDGGCSSEKALFEVTCEGGVRGSAGLERAMQMLHLMLRNADQLDAVTLQRIRRQLAINWDSNTKDLEAFTGRHTMSLISQPTTHKAPDHRFCPVTPDDAEVLELEDMKRALRQQLASSNLEICAVGDFDKKDFEKFAVRYLGTLPERKRFWDDDEVFAEIFHAPMRNRAVTAQVTMPDDVERSYVCMAFGSLNRWGVFHYERNLFSDFPGGERRLDQLMKQHGDMFISRCLTLIQDMLNSRLFKSIREQKGFVYSVALEWDPFHFMDAGYFTVTMMPVPSRTQEAVDSVKLVIEDFVTNGFTDEELEDSREPTLVEIEENMRNNDYWLSLLQGIQSDGTLPKSMASIKDIGGMYQSLEKADVLGVARAAFRDYQERLVVCKGVTGAELKQDVKIE